MGYSETVRRALAHYYEHRDRPTPEQAQTETAAALHRQVEALAQQVAQLTSAVLQLTAEVRIAWIQYRLATGDL